MAEWLSGSGRVACSDLGVVESSMVSSVGTKVRTSSTVLSLSITTFDLWAASMRGEMSERRWILSCAALPTTRSPAAVSWRCISAHSPSAILSGWAGDAHDDIAGIPQSVP